MYELIKKDAKFEMTTKHRVCFQSLKDKLADIPNLAPYDVRKPLQLTTTPVQWAMGISGVLSQDGRPVAFASRKLTKAEMNYCPMERETQHFYLFFAGQHFTWITDHKPLETLLGPKSSISKIAAQ